MERDRAKVHYCPCCEQGGNSEEIRRELNKVMVRTSSDLYRSFFRGKANEVPYLLRRQYGGS
jgi:hypothetical protein